MIPFVDVNINFSWVMMIVFVLFGIVLPIISGAFVYYDACRRGMNALLWAFVVVFVPGLIGVIVYIIVASNTKRIVRCRKCGGETKDGFTWCPYCGTEMTEN